MKRNLKKSKKSVVDLPLDCIFLVSKFFNEQEDFDSLIYLFSGFYEYLLFYKPDTSTIQFKISRCPKKINHGYPFVQNAIIKKNNIVIELDRLKDVLSRFSNLKILSIEKTVFSLNCSNHFKFNFGDCIYLKQLKLHCLSSSYWHSMNVLSLPLLEHIELKNGEFCQQDYAKFVFTDIPNGLKYLHLQGCVVLMERIYSTNFLDLTSFSTIETLKLIGNSFFIWQDHDLVLSSKNFPNLQDLTIDKNIARVIVRDITLKSLKVENSTFRSFQIKDPFDQGKTRNLLNYQRAVLNLDNTIVLECLKNVTISTSSLFNDILRSKTLRSLKIGSVYALCFNTTFSFSSFELLEELTIQGIRRENIVNIEGLNNLRLIEILNCKWTLFRLIDLPHLKILRFTEKLPTLESKKLPLFRLTLKNMEYDSSFGGLDISRVKEMKIIRTETRSNSIMEKIKKRKKYLPIKIDGSFFSNLRSLIVHIEVVKETSEKCVAIESIPNMGKLEFLEIKCYLENVNHGFLNINQLPKRIRGVLKLFQSKNNREYSRFNFLSRDEMIEKLKEWKKMSNRFHDDPFFQCSKNIEVLFSSNKGK